MIKAKNKRLLRNFLTIVMGAAFFMTQFSARFYLLSSRPVFAAAASSPTDQYNLSSRVVHCDHFAILSFDKRFAAKKLFSLITPAFEPQIATLSPRPVYTSFRKHRYYPVWMLTEVLRGPPSAQPAIA